MSKGGKREGAGRPKGSLNKSNILIAEILEYEKQNLVEVAIKLAKEGNTAIMNKLLDKILPDLSRNENIENKNQSIDDYLSEIVEKNNLKVDRSLMESHSNY